jgi:hypothetical protein
MIVACGFWFGLIAATHLVRSYAARAVRLKNHEWLKRTQTAVLWIVFPLSAIPESAHGIGNVLFAAPMIGFVRAAALIAAGAIVLKFAEKG